MKKIIILILSLLCIHLAYGQSDKELTLQLYTKSIDTFFTQLNSYNKVKNTAIKPEFLVIQDSLPKDLPLIYKNFTIRIVKNQSDAINTLEDQNKKTGAIYIITRKFEKDTLDVSINGWGILIKKGIYIKHGRLITKQIFLQASCGGTMGYIPTGRFVHDYVLNKWSYNSYLNVPARTVSKL
jgi:hypothetical protein